MTARLGIITGSEIEISRILEGIREERIATPYGEPSSDVQIGLVNEREVALLFRHGKQHRFPPHRVNSKANIHALSELGVERIVGTSSVGSLKKEIKPMDFVVPSDYVSFWNIPTFNEEEVVHITPVLDPELRKKLVGCIRSLGYEVHDGGVYIQTVGPRLETKAEIRIFEGFGDLVGMTMSSEATLAVEKDIPYASICSVDNYCHGILDEELSYDRILENQRKNSERLFAVISKAIEVLA
ncbi:MAG: MTAP family purine nucleoside phosphorylase [Thermoplasmata archaeon]